MSAEDRFFYRISKPSQRGMSKEEFYAMLDRQEGKCGVCRNPLNITFGIPVTFVVDHSHATGDNRGILCPKCNLGLGHFDDDPERMRRAAEYVS